MKEPAEEVMLTTERLVALEDARPCTGISAVRRTGMQASAHQESLVSIDTADFCSWEKAAPVA